MAVAPLLVRGTLLLLALALPVAAQEALELETKSGNTLKGRVLESDDKTVEFETSDGATMTLQVDALVPLSQYRLRKAAVPTDDAAGLLALAEWCVTQTLYTQARANYRAALEAGPAMADKINASLMKARTTASKEVLARAKQLQEDGKVGEARSLLTQLVQELPLEPASEEAARMLAAEKTQRQQKAEVVDDRDPSDGTDAGQRFSDEAHAMFEKSIASYKRALDDNHDGLTDKGTGAIKKFEQGLSELDKARKETKAAVDRGAHQPPDQDAALKEIDLKIGELDTDLRLNLCNSYIMRSSYNQAADVVNAGLANDPQNKRLLDARDRVAQANSNGDNGWFIGRR